MTRHEIGPDVAIHLAGEEAVIPYALITLDRQLAGAAKNLVTVAPIEALF